MTDHRVTAGVSLDAWLAQHGPLWPSAALVLILDICAQVSLMSPSDLRRCLASLRTQGIRRRMDGTWTWQPLPSADAVSTRASDIIERLGVILFHSLSGREIAAPLPGEHELRSTLRTVRPEMPAQIADLTTRAVCARRIPGLSMAMFTRDVRWALGETHAPSRSIAWLAAGVAVLLFAGASGAWMILGKTTGAEGSGALGLDTGIVDAATEVAAALALVDEHTAAIQVYREVGRLLVRRVPAAHPRVAWNDVHEAWVRTLAGDRLTAEQLLGAKPSWLAVELGDSHPYLRTVRLALATTLEMRGRTAEGAVLRQLADESTRRLFPSTWDLTGFQDDPVPPGVIAHIGPQAPEREGFREDRAGGFMTPLTTAQRISAMESGWKLWIVAAGSCRVSMMTGAEPRRVDVDVARTNGGQWHGSVTGITPVVEFSQAPGETVALAVSMTPDASVEIAVGKNRERWGATLDMTREPLVPPYVLDFEESSAGCAVVWLEIPFPVNARFQPVRQAREPDR